MFAIVRAMARRIFVGLSGGVDSAVSAALLKERGEDVVGVFIKIWQPEFLECTWKEDRMDAMRVAAALEIPFLEVDLSEAYKESVIDPMVASYARGETPNPDVLCNQRIKFGVFSEWARTQGASMVATGHYARTTERGGHVELLRGVDRAKDQSYFLHRIEQRELARAIFPLGAYTKTHVRAEARRFGIPVAERPDSQGLCFVGAISMSDFLGRYIPHTRGTVLDEEGKGIGEHDGAPLYTIGQRHGFQLSRAQATPLYVVGIDTTANTLRVSPHRLHAASAKVSVRDAHWIHRAPALPLRTHAEARYHEHPVPLTLVRQEGEMLAIFDTPHIVAPGQSLVFYDGDVCLGGCIIGKDASSSQVAA